MSSVCQYLDVTFREDANHTLEKQAAFNLNIVRKLALHVLKLFEAGRKPLSLRKNASPSAPTPKSISNVSSCCEAQETGEHIFEEGTGSCVWRGSIEFFSCIYARSML